MSRIGKLPIEIPKGIKIEQKGQHINVAGLRGTMEMDCHSYIKVKIDESAAVITVINDRPETASFKQLHGTMRALIANMVTGVSKGFEKKMMIYGTGYNIKEQGGKCVLSVGYCHPVELPIPKGLKLNITIPATRGNDVPAKFSVSGFDKHLVGQFAANIRKTRPPEPYKGKGIRYEEEYVRRKVGKAFASGAA